MTVRVRYAPSPTGQQHIGGIRTALFNYFFARSQGGKFLLRIEDTDQERSHPQALEDLFSTLAWLGIDYDEGPGKDGKAGPYTQSERQSIYQEKIQELLSTEKAYPCFCSPQRLSELRDTQKINKKNFGYDRHCRNIPPQEAQKRLEAAEKHVIRFKIPLEGKTHFADLILGENGRKNKDISPDPIILKTDGFPTYHLANVIDDHLMGITHVLRAQEWIPSGPLHILLYQAFGWSPPHYAHLPMVMGKDGLKLSKRHGATAVTAFHQNGYLPEALINYISLLGWSYDDSREFFSKEELCHLFSLEKIKKSPAIFDYKKLDWFNGRYIRNTKPEILKNKLIKQLQQDGLILDPPSKQEEKIFHNAYPILQERLKTLNDVSPLLRFLYQDPGIGNPEDSIPKRMTPSATAKILNNCQDILRKSPPAPSNKASQNEKWDQNTENSFRLEAEKNAHKVAFMLQPLRYALSASKISLPLFPSIRLLGIEETLRRSSRLIAALEDQE